MEKKYQDLLQKFWTEDVNDFDLSSNDIDREILNEFFESHSCEQIRNLVLREQDGWYSGWVFFERFHDSIEEIFKEKFLFTVWMMFRSYTIRNDGWHNWRGQFDPLYQVDPKTKYAELFREGYIRFELSGELGDLESSYQYGWWKNLNHFLVEIIEYRDEDFVFKYVKMISGLLFPQKNFEIEKNSSKNRIVEELISFLGENTHDIDGLFLDMIWGI
jgi:hypothetical protein